MTEPFGGYTPPSGHRSADERHGGVGKYPLRDLPKATEADVHKRGSGTPGESAYVASKLEFRESGRVKILLVLLGLRRRPKRFCR